MNEIVFAIGYTTPKPTRKQVLLRQQAEHAKARAFYNLSAEYNYFTYTLNGKKVSKNKTYLDYMQKNETKINKDNTGVFNTKKVLTMKELEELKERASNTKSIIWHGFISFNEEQTKRFQDQESCIHFLNHTMSTLFENSHISMKNIELFASLHTDKAHHHHIHFSFYEKEPSRKDKSGALKFSEKGNFEKANIDNFMISSGLYLEDTKQDYHVARDCAMSELKRVCKTMYKNKDMKEVEQHIVELANSLPMMGRNQYNSQSLDNAIREKVDEIVKEITIKDKRFGEAYLNVLKEIAVREEQGKRIARENKMFVVNENKITAKQLDTIHNDLKESLKNEKDGTAYRYRVGEDSAFRQTEKLKKDFKGRVGGEILGIAKSIRKNGLHKGKKNIVKVARRKQHGIAEKELKRLLSLSGSIFKVKTNFTYDLHRVENEIKTLGKEA